jgi:glyoxylase-like metal-dependent hydrolase (beta-lactamase superfamily II)
MTQTSTRSLTSREVAPGIHRIEWPFAGRLACCYALVGDRVLVVDSGLADTPDEHVLPYLDSIGVEREQVRWLLASHADLDHTGGNGSLLAGARTALLLCHELDRRLVEDADRLFHDRYDEFGDAHGIHEAPETLDWVRDNARHVPVDLTVVGGERLRLADGWEVELLHTPGHSRGHLSVLDPRSGALVIADAALLDGLPGLDGNPLAPPTYRHVDSYLATIGQLRALRPSQLLTAHYPVLDADQALDFLDASRAYVDRVDRVLRGALEAAEDGLTSPELLAETAGDLGWPDAPATQLIFPVAGHLERLEAAGAIDADGGRWRWRGAGG